jgi:hypothetical protein
MVSPIYHVLKTTSELLILFGVLQIMLRAKEFRPRYQLRIGAALLPVWILGLYHLSMKIALCKLWLDLANIQVIYSVANTDYGIELTYIAVYLLVTLSSIGIGSDSRGTVSPDLSIGFKDMVLIFVPGFRVSLHSANSPVMQICD